MALFPPYLASFVVLVLLVLLVLLDLFTVRYDYSSPPLCEESAAVALPVCPPCAAAAEKKKGNCATPIPGDIENWFFNHKVGRVVWKWHHYFDIYEEIFRRFRWEDHPVSFVEIGTRDGGSLEMWKSYFGPSSRIIGIDINPKAEVFHNIERNITMHIGSQNDRDFLKKVVSKVGAGTVQIVLDDASHDPVHQLTSFEELLPILAPYSVYVVEDVLYGDSVFMSKMYAIIHSQMNLRGPADPYFEVALFKGIAAVFIRPPRYQPRRDSKQGDIAIECGFQSC